MVLATRSLLHHRDAERVVTWQGGRDKETKQADTMWKTTSRLKPLYPCGSNPGSLKVTVFWVNCVCPPFWPIVLFLKPIKIDPVTELFRVTCFIKPVQ